MRRIRQVAEPPGKAPKVDYKEVLEPEEFEVFSRLREWRKGAAEKAGVPVHVVLRNEQLAPIMRLEKPSLAPLEAINGIGPAKTRKYGEAFLTALAATEQNKPGARMKLTRPCPAQVLLVNPADLR